MAIILKGECIDYDAKFIYFYSKHAVFRTAFYEMLEHSIHSSYSINSTPDTEPSGRMIMPSGECFEFVAIKLEKSQFI